MRKNYASQESIATTLTAAERAAPFREAEPDFEPLPKRTREAVLIEGDAVAIVDPATGGVIGLEGAR